MQLADYLSVLTRYWGSVLVVTTTGLLAAGAISFYATPTYTASASVFVAVDAGGTAVELQQGSTYAENQVKSFAQVVSMPIVLAPVIQKLGLQTTVEDLAQTITTAVPTGTAIIRIEVVGTDPVRTAELTNEISDQLLAAVQRLSPQGSGGTGSVVATVVAPASVPTVRTSPRTALNLAIGGLLGFAIGLAQGWARTRLDTRVVTERDVRSIDKTAVIGTIGVERNQPMQPLMMTEAHSARAEEFRRLRTNLQFLSLERAIRTIVITSSLAGEGKTITAINIASTLADAGESVLLVDCDLRRPAVARRLGLEAAAGLTTALLGRARLSDLVQPVGTGNLHVLTSGQLPPNPSELLGSPSMKRLLQEASDRYDTVILDSPPLLPVTDAAVLTRHAAGALIVVGSGEVRRQQLTAALEAITNGGGTTLGFILNKVSVGEAHYRTRHYRAAAEYAGHGAPELNWNSTKRAGVRSLPLSPEDVVTPDSNDSVMYTAT